MALYLLDTNILSETRRPRPDAGVVKFLGQANRDSLYISVLSLGELRKGVEAKRRADPLMAAELGRWVDGIETTFAAQVLPVTIPVARLWGELSAGRSLPVIDMLIAATALVHGLTVVTRNTADFAATAVPVLNPWGQI